MKKRAILFLTAIALLFAACGQDANETQDPATEEKAVTEEEMYDFGEHIVNDYLYDTAPYEFDEVYKDEMVTDNEWFNKEMYIRAAKSQVMEEHNDDGYTDFEYTDRSMEEKEDGTVLLRFEKNDEETKTDPIIYELTVEKTADGLKLKDVHSTDIVSRFINKGLAQHKGGDIEYTDYPEGTTEDEIENLEEEREEYMKEFLFDNTAGEYTEWPEELQ